MDGWWIEMATIIEGALWTLTDKAAEKMAEDELIYRCDSNHNVVDADLPIYHVTDKGEARGVGLSTMGGYIKRAEREVEECQ